MGSDIFKNQVAIVSGAGVGIGFEIVKNLVLRGTNVVLNDINEALALAASAKINEEGKGKCLAFGGDISELDTIRNIVNFALKEFGQIDILIANAGITTFGDFWEYTPESMNAILKTNLFGTFFLTQEVTKQMVKQGTGGSVLLTSSVTAHAAHKNLAAYGMTKAAIDQLAKNLIVDLAPQGININTIVPGATLTERTLEDAEYIETWSRITPSGRPATVSDIANAALFLVSPMSRQITGQNLVIDGGWTSVGVSPY
ncbi:SDR family oxidoreductase [Lacihabitans sp. LS3-19]|uniref:SDR family NAD(P)-dependent oxidoreductase n=1 Tax=Lacihabitans sp. LS3-19 TaxID=2487335 RepID=UPI0020CCE33B|nr:SDR family oxidoreductase [Lacihabitans sp. LS3-19]MCP9770513.1 SDR family oxidoreductase [Lacihabitans sp. LS3-19]